MTSFWGHQDNPFPPDEPRAECQRAVKAYCQKNNADESDAWKLIAETIGKPSKDFTAEDWKQGQQIAEAWK